MGRTRPFGTIRTLKSGRHQARYWRGGQQVAADSTFATKAEARAWLAKVETEIGDGTYVDPSAGDEHFSDYAECWLTQRNLRSRTRDTYASQLTHIVARFGTVELRQITSTEVRSWHGELIRSDLHPNTVAKIYRLFRTMLDTAVDDGLIRTNPVHIKGAAVEKMVERPILEWADVQRLAELIEPRFSAVVWTAAFSGLRFGELTGLTRNHVDLAGGLLRVDRALTFERGRGSTFGPPKSVASNRTVMIPPTAVAILSAHIDEYTSEEPDSLIFLSVKGKPLLNRYFGPYWRRALADAGMDEGVRFHDLRHLAGTSAATAGASLKEVMARMGHASPDASLRYLKASGRRDSEIAESIERRMIQDLDIAE